jgi:hypothetical protein
MKYALAALCALTMLAAPAAADPWKDESGKGRWGYYDRGHRAFGYDREYKQEFRQGNCKIERKWERGGEYKEEIKCKGGYRY